MIYECFDKIISLYHSLEWYILSLSPRRGGWWVGAFLLIFLLTSCSTTSNLPEDETLYTGIYEIAYGHKAMSRRAKKEARNDSTGVITSIADAYVTVENMLAGSFEAKDMMRHLSENQQQPLTREQKDSLKQAIRLVEAASATAREEVDAALAAAPNGSIFGSSSVRWPFQIGLGVYNKYLNSESGFGKWMLSTFGSTPVYISTVNPRLRTQVAKNILRNHGFFHASAQYDIETDARNPRKAKVGYSLFPGPLFRLGSIEYQNFDAVTDSIVKVTMPLTKLQRGAGFSAATLDAERTRLSEAFRNNGFYLFRPEYVAFRADTLMKPLEVQLQIRPRADMPAQAHNQFRMGRTRVSVLRSTETFEFTDSFETRRNGHFVMRWAGNTKEPPLKLSAVRRNLFYETGSLYRHRMHTLIQDKLSGMGVFSTVQMRYSPRDTTDTCTILDVDIFAVLDKPYDSELEAKVTNKSNGLLGPGLSWGMTKRNALRGAELLNFKIYGSYEWQTGVQSSEGRSSMINSYELGTSVTLTYPLIRFFGLARPLNRKAQASTSFKFDVDWMNRASYFQMLSLSGRVAYTYSRRPWLRHELVPFRLDYDILLHKTASFDSIMNANQALYVSMRNQFVPSMAYTLTYAPRPRDGRSRAIIFSAKEAGNVVSSIYALNGRSWNEKDKSLFDVPFAQFWKLTLEWRETFPVTKSTSLATRAFMGGVWSYGNSLMAPYNDLFNVGGANSIRAFGVRTIGPGGYHPASSSWSYVDQVGTCKFEANVEYRFPLVGGLNGAVFVDAGNVWLLKDDESRHEGYILSGDFLRKIALGTGFGFRYDLDFLVLRFDIGVGIHAPYDTGRSSYYNMPRFWDSLGFHIAVGYPF